MGESIADRVAVADDCFTPEADMLFVEINVC
jgi:hypothetical protein